MFVEENTDTDYDSCLNFSTRFIKEIYFLDNQYGMADTVFRMFTLTAQQIQEKFPKHDCKHVTEAIKTEKGLLEL